MIPQNVLDAIDRYVKHRLPPGSFFRAVFENNLTEAICKADRQNLAILKDIVMHIYWNIPADCWGSPEKVKKWLDGKDESTRSDKDN